MSNWVKAYDFGEYETLPFHGVDYGHQYQEEKRTIEQET